MLSPEQCARVRALNDALRQHSTGGRLQVTRGVLALDSWVTGEVLLAVAAFDDFSARNDPHREQDFGAFEIEGRQLFWKIDYYAPGFESAALDPADESICIRVLTVMLAEEY